ncbi:MULTISPECIES: LemA family protein [unclassified Photobacterium]|uniref:LemA family protein n=1 Tax=unclassified Photobacterium TaxID=2628852 RepID=UPI000D1513CD|nr:MULTISPECIES: LemA family protein [unclassified Photobacterium]PSV38022.1 LemA family protein [Photobacterium sp. GB-210]PSV41796.1 LemA family protein [Photobacterium sp. GB-36]PSW74220.1 LemA family protein [Photobacterium sp. GB-50]
MFNFPKILKWVFSLALLLQLTGCGINTIPMLDEQVNADWAQVENNYQRRADLIPNLVATVKGYASHEKDTLTAVTEARAKVSSMQVTPETIDNPEAFKKFEAAQGQLSSALSRLMVVSERYPDLKANEQFITLQAQLEGTENRIAVARRDYINSVKAFNTEIRTFPGRFWHWIMYSDLTVKPNFSATTPNADVAPKVAF